jgi:hypothetical protein
VRRCLWVGGGRVQPGHQSGAQMAAHDHEGSNAAQALEVTVLAGDMYNLRV